MVISKDHQRVAELGIEFSQRIGNAVSICRTDVRVESRPPAVQGGATQYAGGCQKDVRRRRRPDGSRLKQRQQACRKLESPATARAYIVQLPHPFVGA